MLSTDEQRALLAELEPKLRGADADWLLLYYRCKLEPEQGKQLAEAYARQAEGGEEEAAVGGAGGDGGDACDGGAGAAGGSSDGAAGSMSGAILELRDNCDMLTAAAEYEYAHDHFRKCYQLSCRVLAKDPFQKHVLPVHVCSMMRLDYHSVRQQR